MKNHEVVPVQLIATIARLKFGGTPKATSELLKNKLVWHDGKKYDGYRLTYLGYDYLALKTLVLRGIISAIGNKVGVGKESDVYLVSDEDGKEMVMKLHRLGRTSFRTIKKNRDYLKHRKSASWLYLSRLAALKEFAYMKALHDNGFPTPIPIDVNRHCVIMSVVPGYPLNTVTHMEHPEKIYSDLMNLIVRFAAYGLIHSDFNEFNIMINNNEDITIIDFPQMVSTSHPNAEMYFDRDVLCIRTFFSRRYGYENLEYPTFQNCAKMYDLDVVVTASGFTKQNQKEFEELQENEKNQEKETPVSKETVEENEEDQEKDTPVSKEIVEENEENQEKDALVCEEIVEESGEEYENKINSQQIARRVHKNFSKKFSSQYKARNVMKSKSRKEQKETIKAFKDN